MTGRWPDQRVAAPVNLHRWESLTFLHWAVRPEVVRQLLPAELTVDTFDGDAWVGVTPFLMRDVRAPGVPPLPHLSTFGEVNVRTYVRAADGSAGVWFFSLECARLPFVLAMNALGLPYRWSDVELSGDDGRYAYRSRRRRDGVGMRAAVRVRERVEPDEQLDFLTGRWSAYTRRAGRLWRVPVEHPPWPLHRAEARAAVGPLLEDAGLPAPHGQPLAHFSPAIDVRIGAPRLVRPAPRGPTSRQ